MSPRQLALGIVLFSLGSAFLADTLIEDHAAGIAIFVAAFLACANALLALLLAQVGLSRQTTKAFFVAILGGMLLRMCATLGGFIIGLKVLLLPPTAFAAALLTYTGLFIAAETSLWARQDFSKDRLKIS